MSVEQSTTGQQRAVASDTSLFSIPHPLDQLSVTESDLARDVILNARGPNVAINFRSIFLEEPLKKELSYFLELEHSGRVTAQTPRPARLAKVQYDIVRDDKHVEYIESLVDVARGKEIRQRTVDKPHQPGLTT
jgi:primary-amine oxidase